MGEKCLPLEGGGTADAVTEGERAQNVPPERFGDFGVLVHKERESGLVRSPSKSLRFSHPLRRAHEYCAEYFAVCGQRQWGVAPLTPSSIFYKIAASKNLLAVFTCFGRMAFHANYYPLR